MTKKFKLASLASATAALLVILPLARTARIAHATNIQAQGKANLDDAASRQRAQNAVTFATNAAYRDGLFQGRLAASQNLEPRIPMGRWSAQTDKDAFATGYHDGYALGLADNK
jgi:hypothetical protein